MTKKHPNKEASSVFWTMKEKQGRTDPESMKESGSHRKVIQSQSILENAKREHKICDEFKDCADMLKLKAATSFRRHVQSQNSKGKP